MAAIWHGILLEVIGLISQRGKATQWIYSTVYTCMPLYICVNKVLYIVRRASFFDRFIRYITASFATEYELQQVSVSLFAN